MYALSAAIDVNPPGEPVHLTRAMLWAGLVMKAENAVLFVPSITHCNVLERFEDGFIREIELRGVRMRERITLTPRIEIRFQRLDTDHGGWITNCIHDSPHGLQLSFSFAMRFPGIADGSAAETAAGDAVRESYLSAITATLATCRRLAAEKSLAAAP